MRNVSTLAAACLLLAILAFVPGCREAASPVDTAPAVDLALLAENSASNPPGGMWARYYPLRTGNHWRYDRQFRAWDDAGLVDIDVVGESTREIIGEEVLFGRTYMVEEWRITEPAENGDETFTYWIRRRQDGNGLFEADVAISEPPALIAVAGKEAEPRPSTVTAARNLDGVDAIIRNEKHAGRRAAMAAHFERHRRLVAAALRGMEAASGSLAGLEEEEITRLVYPLRRGQKWVIRDDPFFGAEVEGRELLRLPVGQRVGVRLRITPPIVGPDDNVLMWFSNCGLLSVYVFVESVMTDPTGNPIGMFYSEEIVELFESDVSGRPWCGR